MNRARPRRPAWLTRGVGSIGVASFFSDAGHEIATALLPTFVTTTLRSSAGALGLIEGIADALTGIAKLVAGPFANDTERRRRMATGGYVVTAVATGALGAATTVWQVGIARATAWTARGVRTPARDALLASLAPPGAYGRAYGLERAGDNLGAVVGPLLAAGLISWIGVRNALYLSAVPGLFAAAAIGVAAAEARRRIAPTVARSRLQLRALRGHGLARPMVPIAMFELANMATALLILRATDLLQADGRSATDAAALAILIYTAHNLTASMVAYLGGHWIDRAGSTRAFATGALLFAAAYAGFALPLEAWPLLLGAFVLAGAGVGVAETAESTVVARALPDELRGSGFGLLGGIQSFGDFAASATVGLLWTAVSPSAAFAYAAAWMGIAALSAIRMVPNDRDPARSA